MVKQVIVVRKDLKMRRGKEVAQGAHASMKWLCDRLSVDTHGPECSPVSKPHSYVACFDDDEVAWIDGIFLKVCVRVDSEEELMEVYEKAKAVCKNVHLIKDAGRTEFDGPTYTCLAIGPDKAETIDQVTGHLKLY